MADGTKPRTWAEIRAAAKAAGRKPTVEEILECQDELSKIFEDWSRSMAEEE